MENDIIIEQQVSTIGTKTINIGTGGGSDVEAGIEFIYHMREHPCGCYCSYGLWPCGVCNCSVAKKEVFQLMWVLVWMQLISGQPVDHFQLAVYETSVECEKNRKRADYGNSQWNCRSLFGG